MKTYAAFGGAGGEIVLDAVALEDRDAAVVALDGQGDGEAAPRVFSAVTDIVGEVDGIGGLVELSASHFEDLRIIQGGDNCFGHGSRGGFAALGGDLFMPIV